MYLSILLAAFFSLTMATGAPEPQFGKVGTISQSFVRLLTVLYSCPALRTAWLAARAVDPAEVAFAVKAIRTKVRDPQNKARRRC